MSKAELVVIVPSRGRPEAIADLVIEFAKTCTAETRLVVAVDKTDPLRDEYSTVHDAVIFTNSHTMVEALNHAVWKIVSAAPKVSHLPFAIGFVGDDHRPRTVGWDRAYLDALHDLGTGMVYGNDLLQGENIPTQIAMTTDIIQALGHMAWPLLRHLYVDNYWLELGKKLNCIRYLPDVVVEHVHPFAGKAAMDEGYQRVNAPEMNNHDWLEFQKWQANHLESDVKKVEQCMR